MHLNNLCVGHVTDSLDQYLKKVHIKDQRKYPSTSDEQCPNILTSSSQTVHLNFFLHRSSEFLV